MCTIAVTNHTAEGAVARSCSRVNQLTVEETVADGKIASIIVVSVTNKTAIVTIAFIVVAVKSARICATVNCCFVTIECTTKDTTNLSTYQFIVIVYLAVDVLNEDTTFTSDCNKSDCSACYTSRNSHGAFCCEVLDGSTCRELTEQAIVLTFSCVSDVLDGMSLTIECALVRNIIGTD